MIYSWMPRQPRYRGPVHWGHKIELYVTDERLLELKNFLDEVVGKYKWRVRSKNRPKLYNVYYNNYTPQERIIRVLSKESAFRVKLMWNECERPATMTGVVDFLKRWSKLALNSNYGKLGTLGTFAAGTGVGKSMISQQIANPCDEIPLMTMDYESSYPGTFDFSKVRPQGSPFTHTVTIDYHEWDADSSQRPSV